jgi:hypothetical protein
MRALTGGINHGVANWGWRAQVDIGEVCKPTAVAAQPGHAHHRVVTEILFDGQVGLMNLRCLEVLIEEDNGRRTSQCPGLRRWDNLGKGRSYGAEIIALCRSESLTTSPRTTRNKPDTFSRRPSITLQKSSSRPERSGVERPTHFVESASTSSTVETFTRPRTASPEPTEPLTPDQQTLDLRLREWRKSESEKLNLPLFFVLASTTLRSIVLARPQTLSQLKTIQGLGHEKIEKFGPGIIEICST